MLRKEESSEIREEVPEAEGREEEVKRSHAPLYQVQDNMVAQQYDAAATRWGV